jgi:hypothetical protein
MIIQVHITNEQLAAYLKLIGYETEMVDITEWRSEYHNRSELYQVPRLHVVLSDGSKKPAKEFFEKLIDETIINLLKSNKNGNKKVD